MSTSKMSVNDFQNKVLSELAEIREMIASAKPNSSSDGKVKKERKPRDPNAKPNDWIVFTSRVRSALKAADMPAGKECQQFASYLKNEHLNAYDMADDEIVAARKDWNAPPSKPKAETEDVKPAPSVDESKPKPKRTLSDEQKAKMAAGRKAAAERKKAEKEVVESENAPSSLEDVKSHSKSHSKSPSPPQPVPVVQSETKPTPSLRALPFKGKKYMWDPESNGLWLQNKDGSKGPWAGVLASDRKSIDASAPNHQDINGADEE
jgi:hypothetical protein